MKRTYITWHSVGNCGEIHLAGIGLGDNTAVKHEGAAYFLAPKGQTFDANDLTLISKALEEESSASTQK